jgi:hypothetical protein
VIIASKIKPTITKTIPACKPLSSSFSRIFSSKIKIAHKSDDENINYIMDVKKIPFHQAKAKHQNRDFNKYQNPKENPKANGSFNVHILHNVFLDLNFCNHKLIPIKIIIKIPSVFIIRLIAARVGALIVVKPARIAIPSSSGRGEEIINPEIR